MQRQKCNLQPYRFLVPKVTFAHRILIISHLFTSISISRLKNTSYASVKCVATAVVQQGSRTNNKMFKWIVFYHQSPQDDGRAHLWTREKFAEFLHRYSLTFRNSGELLPPAYVVRREGNSFTLSVHTWGGGVRSSRRGGGGSGPASGGGGSGQSAWGGVRSVRGGGQPR